VIVISARAPSAACTTTANVTRGTTVFQVMNVSTTAAAGCTK